MPPSFYLPVIISIIYAIYYIRSTNSKNAIQKKLLVKATDEAMKSNTEESPYEGLRKLTFATTPEQLNIVLDASMTEVFGVVMDWDMGNAIVTVVAFRNGDASVYIDKGPIFIGGGTHENIKNAAMQFVGAAQKYLTKASVTFTNPYPDKNFVRFHLKTNKGDFTFQEKSSGLQSGNSEFSELFNLGNNIIAEYKMISGKT